MTVEVHINGNVVFTAVVQSIIEGADLCGDLLEKYRIKELIKAGVRAFVCVSEVRSGMNDTSLSFNELLEREAVMSDDA